MKPTFRIALRLGLMAFIALHTAVAFAATNVAPTATIISAAMRPGTTLMDVTYLITDPDDATVKVRALAFKEGVRSFANVIRPVTWMEGSQTNIGDAITTGVNHTLTWDVRADWNIDLANVKFEVLAVDSSGILPFQGITIPAAAGQPELKINQIGLSDTNVFDALLWMYASGNSNMEIAGGTLVGSATSGIFKEKPVVVGKTLNQEYAQPFLSKLLNFSLAGTEILTYAETATRKSFDRNYWHTTDQPYVGTQFIYTWGNGWGETNRPTLFCDVVAIAACGNFSLALKNDNTVVGWGYGGWGQLNIPAGLSGVTAIAGGMAHSLALKNDGTVVAWGYNNAGQLNIPAGLSGVTAISAAAHHSLALKTNGTVVGFGDNGSGQSTVPPGLSNVTAIAAGAYDSLALKNDGTVVVWGDCAAPPAGLSGVTAIAAGNNHALALKSDGSVVVWGNCAAPPAGLSGVTAIAANSSYCVALKNDGTVVAWGNNDAGQLDIPAGLANVAAISAGEYHVLATAKAP